MADSKSTDTAALRQMVRQRLISLKLFGIDEWAQPAGSYTFELSDPESGPAPPAAASRIRAKREPKPASTSRAATPVNPTGSRSQTKPPQNQTLPSSKSTEASSRPKPARTAALQPAASCEPYSPSQDLADRTSSFQILRDSVSECKKCLELANRRHQTVFGEGNLQPRLVFLGEAPGEDEDRQGVPFAGRAGQLLTKIIEAMKLSREDVFILNTVKCRPPLNRNPNESEISNCSDYLEQQLDILQPEIICCLGSVAARTLLQTTNSIGRLRGQFFQYRASKVLVTYHPSYLLRTENESFRGKSPKRMVWDDMKLILSELEASEG